MAIPKKGSRKIVVNGENYRWLITDYSRLSPLNTGFTVEKSENGHCVLRVTFTEILNFADFSLTPKLVSHAIKLALKNGWQPEQKGSAFELRLNSEEHNF